MWLAVDKQVLGGSSVVSSAYALEEIQPDDSLCLLKSCFRASGRVSVSPTTEWGGQGAPEV